MSVYKQLALPICSREEKSGNTGERVDSASRLPTHLLVRGSALTDDLSVPTSIVVDVDHDICPSIE